MPQPFHGGSINKYGKLKWDRQIDTRMQRKAIVYSGETGRGLIRKTAINIT